MNESIDKRSTKYAEAMGTHGLEQWVRSAKTSRANQYRFAIAYDVLEKRLGETSAKLFAKLLGK